MHAKDILRRWNLDPICDKSFVLILGAGDRSGWVAEGFRLPVDSKELNEIFNEEVSFTNSPLLALLQNPQNLIVIFMILFDFRRTPFKAEIMNKQF